MAGQSSPATFPASRASAPVSSVGRSPLAWTRAIAVVAWSGVGFAVWGVGALLTLVMPPLFRWWRHWAMRAWASGVALIIGMRVRTIGRPPDRPFLLVSNHLSYLDVIVFASRLGGTFVAKHDVRSWPGLGTLAAASGTIFVRRDIKRDAVRVAGVIESRWKRGNGVIFFPEGTSSGGAEVLPLKPALFAFAARSSVPVHHACLSYRTPLEEPPADQSVCWWGDMTFGRHVIDVFRVRRFEATIVFGDAPIVDTDRKRLAERLREGMVRDFVPVDTVADEGLVSGG